MQGLKIRRYKSSDNPTVLKLHELGLAEIGSKPDYKNYIDKDLREIEEVYLKQGDFIVGEYEGKVVAMVAFKKVNEGVAELKRMRVNPGYQSRGIGQALIEELEKRAKDLGFRKMILDSSPYWVKAQHFYKKNGYKEIRRGLNENKHRAIYYEKSLS